MGAPSAPAIAAMAKILFRMQKLLRDDARAGFAAGTQPSQFIARGIVPGTAPHDSCNFWHFSYAGTCRSGARLLLWNRSSG
jgi:hypothetical protein